MFLWHTPQVASGKDIDQSNVQTAADETRSLSYNLLLKPSNSAFDMAEGVVFFAP